MGINLFGGVRNVGAGGVAPRKQTSVDSSLAMSFKDLVKNQKTTETKNSSKTGDTLTISQQGTVEQKLEELARIHKETDYSGMSDMEIVKTFNKRYEEAFPNFLGKSMVNPEKYQSVSDQKRALLKDTVKDDRMLYLNDEESINKSKEIYGYAGLSNEEIIQRVQEDITDDGTLESKGEVMWRLWGLGVVSTEAFAAFDGNIMYMQRDAYKKAFNPQNLDMQSEHYRSWVNNGGMDNIQISWSELRESVFTNVDIRQVYGEKIANELNDLFDIFIKNEREGVSKNV